jgi:hypothetical protein
MAPSSARRGTASGVLDLLEADGSKRPRELPTMRKELLDRAMGGPPRRPLAGNKVEAVLEAGQPLNGLASGVRCTTSASSEDMLDCWPRSRVTHATARVHHSFQHCRCGVAPRGARAAVGPTKAHLRAVGWQLSEVKRVSRSLLART